MKTVIELYNIESGVGVDTITLNGSKVSYGASGKAKRMIQGKMNAQGITEAQAIEQARETSNGYVAFREIKQ